MDVDPEILHIENNGGTDWTPEQHLWFEVVHKYLLDLDTRTTFLYGKVVPKQASLIKLYFNGLKGEKYWENRAARRRLRKAKTRIKREIVKLKYELESPWFEEVCSMSGLNYDFVKQIAYKLMLNRVKIKNPYSFAEMIESVFETRKKFRSFQKDFYP